MAVALVYVQAHVSTSDLGLGPFTRNYTKFYAAYRTPLRTAYIHKTND
jgi:hypothetical protein